MTERFAKIVNDFRPLTIFEKKKLRESPGYPSGLF